METTRHNPNVHHRRSIRLREYDYRDFGVYFVTVCTHGRVPSFGQIINAEMQLSAYGVLVAAEWERTATMRPHVTLDAFVVMPNHFHALVLFEDALPPSEEGGAARSRACGSTPLPHARDLTPPQVLRYGHKDRTFVRFLIHWPHDSRRVARAWEERR